MDRRRRLILKAIVGPVGHHHEPRLAACATSTKSISLSFELASRVQSP